ncbi:MULTISPECIES: SGNH/GDSL hydrolase family protein [Kocuria]|uniref:SGNH/GDSL hydrolase family protein n=1 Tax=Kocuria TaxID=57493 RepID=UPI0006605077|nr:MULTISPECIES: SGNH/GDSL hydrolase family protein [Kocuria]RUQ23224.1 SGNH/GDSL hydrolase family protein [Kocuria sp. HSID16901]
MSAESVPETSQSPERGPIRFVALGDSFTEGVGDPDPTRPNGVRGWADRVAEQLTLRFPNTTYANLAIRGRTMEPILDEQIEPALALEPTLVSIYAGGNDILRPSLDIDEMMVHYEDAITRLRSSGAHVFSFTGFDAKNFYGVFRSTRGRAAIYNELLREIADRHGVILVDYWRMSKEFSDPRLWSVDRLHMNSLGHRKLAGKVLETLDVTPVVDLGLETLPQLRHVSRVETTRANVDWVREFALPWVGRRLRGTSSGDGMQPRYPELQTLEVTESRESTTVDSGD